MTNMRKNPSKKEPVESRQVKALKEEIEKKELEISGLKNRLSEISDRSLDSNRELQFIKEKLLNVEKMAGLGKMFISMANDLNNLLSGIIGYSQLLLVNPAYPDSLRKELEIIQNQSQRTHKIIKGLLAFSHLQKLEREPLNIHELLEFTVGMKKHYMLLDDIQVILDFSPDIPELIGNPDSLHHLFLNIINNAHRALINHPKERILIIKTQFEKGTIKILFQDTGPGIPLENRDKIFDPFFSTWGEKESLGLGLATSYGIVSEHGGNIYYNDSPTGGSIFIIELPLRKEISVPKHITPGGEKAETAEERKQKQSESGNEKDRVKKILIIDDEESIVSMLSNALEMEGFKITGTTDGQKALYLIDKEDFDMIITDMKMPEVSGIHLYWFVEKKKPEMLDKIVFITGDIIETTTRSFLKTIDNPYFTKPFDVEKFTSVIQSLI